MAAKQTMVLGKSLDLMRNEGYLVEKTEYFVSRPWATKKDGDEEGRTVPGFRKDFYGYIDATGIRPDIAGMLGVQVTTAAHISHRLKKAENLTTTWETKGGDVYTANHLEWWLRNGNRFQIHGWRKGRAGRWQVSMREVRILDGDRPDFFTFEWRTITSVNELVNVRPAPGKLF
jgi:hypothetical protein